MYKPVVLTIAVVNRRQKEAIASGGKRIRLINDSSMIWTVFFLYVNFSVSDFKYQKNIFELYTLIIIIEIELKHPIEIVSEKF